MIEAETGAQLVQRAGRGIRPTQAGRLLADRAAEIIGRINDYQTMIASAIEEQTATTTEMSRSVNVAAGAGGEVSRSVQGLAEAVQVASSGVGQVNSAARELATTSAELQRIVTRFRY